jgi:hypothetical protein
MRQIFTRRDGKFDALEVQRPGLAPERIDCPKQGIIPPLYHVTYTERACAPLPVDTAVVEAVRAGIADLSARWHALPVGGVLSLEV